jgi:putative SbcD/Mre11-related phosphoesterase
MSDSKTRKETIRFSYNESAAILKDGKANVVVIGDLHIGRELSIARNGINIYGATERMADRAVALLKEFKARKLVIIGDVKDSILNPDSAERKLIGSFFARLAGYEVVVVQGNHDAQIGTIGAAVKEKELVIRNVGLVHGNSMPSESVMRSEYILSGHEHPALPYPASEKAWVVYHLNKNSAEKFYKNPNKKAELISMPAFSDLILGTGVGKEKKMLNPLIRRGIFDRESARVYSQTGELVMLGL